MSASKLLRSSSTLLRHHHLFLRPATISATTPTPTATSLFNPATQKDEAKRIPFIQLNGQVYPLGLSTATQYCNLNLICRGKNDYTGKSTPVDDDEDDEDEHDFSDDDDENDDVSDWDDVDGAFSGHTSDSD